MFEIPDGCQVDHRDQWLAVHYGHPMNSGVIHSEVDGRPLVAVIHCYPCDRTLVCKPRSR
jgi:hypothetical protein